LFLDFVDFKITLNWKHHYS